MTREIVQFGVAGDWHGYTRWAEAVLNAFADEGIRDIHHVGDFGLWAQNDGGYRASLQKRLTRHGQRISVTLGNHENFDLLETFPVDDAGWYIDPIADRIRYAPRPHRYTIGSLRVLSLGGAVSVDQYRRVQGTSWWAQEVITEDQVAAAISTGPADFMITHDAPEGAPYLPMGKGSWIPPELLEASRVTRQQIARVAAEAKPTALIHGHWHCHGTADVTVVDAENTDHTFQSYGLAEDQSSDVTTVSVTGTRTGTSWVFEFAPVTPIWSPPFPT